MKNEYLQTSLDIGMAVIKGIKDATPYENNSGRDENRRLTQNYTMTSNTRLI